MSGLHALVLAAGAGARFGGSKLTAEWDGGVLLDGALRAACAAPVDGVVVVTGAHGDAVAAAVDAFGRDVPVRIVACADHAAGMSASLRCGLGALPPDAAGAFLFLGDMPSVPKDIAAMLLHALGGALAAVPVVCGAFGHPVLITRELFDAFSQCAGDGGGRRILRGLGDNLVRVSVDDDGVLADVDTPSDLARLPRPAPPPG